jgi:aminotransferase in exopolysaccharide biosynthesis
MTAQKATSDSDLVLDILSEVRTLFKTSNPIALHTPVFAGNERKYLAECIDSTYVSYVGPFVSRFDQMVQEFTGAAHAVSMVSGTAALHIGLLALGVTAADEVVTQALTFVATTNAISYSDRETLGMSATALATFLESQTFVGSDGCCYNATTKRRIAACLPVHVFGHPCDISRIKMLCASRNIPVLEDAAESLGSFFKGKHTGTFGEVGVLSFNGNNTITTGGGGMLLTNDSQIAAFARHISTTAKQPHPWEFFHDMVGYNYRLSNVSAALGCAQMENLHRILMSKRELANHYRDFFNDKPVSFIDEPPECSSNFWLNAIILKDRAQRDLFLSRSHESGIMCRPIWTLMSKLPMYHSCQRDSLLNAEWLENRVVNLPSSPRL